MLRTVLFILLALADAPAFSAIPVKNPETYTDLTTSDADSLDPAWPYDAGSMSVILNVYEPLFMFDGESTDKLIPLLAQKVPSPSNGLLSPDGKTYTIPIRTGVKFHDGTPLTVDDVRYSLIRFMLYDRAAGPSSLLLAPLTGLTSTRDASGNFFPEVWDLVNKAVNVENNNLILRLPRAYAPFLGILATWSPIVSRTWAIKNGDWDGQEVAWKKFNNPYKESSPFFERANGTGPFRLERWDRKNKEILLQRNDTYWRTPAKLKNIVIKGVNEFGTRKLMLQVGDADSIYANRPLLSQLQGIPGVHIIDDLPTIEMSPVIFFTYQINPTANAYIGSGKLDGNGIPPDFFSDKDVRKAFAYAFDYKGFISDVLRGKGTQAHGVIPKSLPGYAASQETYSLNLKKSEDYLKKAHGGKLWEKGFRFTLAYNSGNVERQSVCQIIKRNIENLNPKFKVELRAIEWPTFLDAQKASKLPIFVSGWMADYPDAHSFTFPMLHSSGEFTNKQHFKDSAMDYLVEEGEKETRLAKRKALYARLQALAYEEVPHLVIADKAVFRTQREWVKGYSHNPIFPDAPYSAYYYPMYKK